MSITEREHKQTLLACIRRQLDEAAAKHDVTNYRLCEATLVHELRAALNTQEAN